MSADPLCENLLATSWKVMQSIHTEEGLQPEPRSQNRVRFLE